MREDATALKMREDVIKDLKGRGYVKIEFGKCGVAYRSTGRFAFFDYNKKSGEIFITTDYQKDESVPETAVEMVCRLAR